MPPTPTRRELLSAGSSALALLLLPSCGRKEPASCNGPVLTPEDVQRRTTLGYVDHTPDDKRRCDECVQYTASASQEQCGTCNLFKGPIHPGGVCNLFVKRD
jgi:hypothetical protein